MSSEIRAALAARGHRLFNIWMLPSFRHKTTFILSSDIAAMYVAHLEVDQTVAQYEVETPTASALVGGERVWTRFDAKVQHFDGSKYLAEVKPDDTPEDVPQTPQILAQKGVTAEAGWEYRLITRSYIEPKANLTWNAFRMLQVLKASDRYSLATATTAIAARLQRGSFELREVRPLDGGDEGLNLAALFTLYMHRKVTTNLNKPLSETTVFTSLEGAR